ncbi:hypothetical protein E3N88_02764 [Mikania micrantha]|uniref:C2H2-type domain-containing protein n=1 Tax=Mikania micrantha TaxID=192012 RepID=A0A5N6Q6Y2_9ASTR|nr:hypothetical protein E3N88_02764 [Mikania micrantha]
MMMNTDNNLQTHAQLHSEFQYWFPALRRFGPDDPFFASGNIERELLAKQVALDFTEEEKQQLRNLDDEDSEVICPIVGCGANLRSLALFEDHYNARHTASCSVCSRVYPTSRLLGIHVSEAHDSFFQAKVAGGYAMPSHNVRVKCNPVHVARRVSPQVPFLNPGRTPLSSSSPDIPLPLPTTDLPT